MSGTLGDFVADRRHQHRLPVAFDKFNAEQILQFTQPRAQGRLGDKAGFRCTGEVKMFRQGKQIMQLADRRKWRHGLRSVI